MITKDHDYKRIQALPRRSRPDPIVIPGLREVQALALGAVAEAQRAGPFYGAAIQMPVGTGKTLVSLLLADVLKATKWKLVVMSHLRRKTEREAIGYRDQGFPVPEVPVCTFGDLSQKNWAKHLTEDLELIVLDEVQKVHNPKAGVTRRLREHVANNPRLRVCVLSANLISRSVADIWHVLDWTHREFSPVPRSYYTAQSWQAALDPNVPEHMRESSEVLLEWPGAEGTSKQSQARRAFMRRIADTSGVYIHESRDLDVPLTVTEWPCEVPPKAAEALDALRKTWVRPDGHQLLLAPEYALAASTLAYGYYHYWETYPEEEWYEARAAYNTFINHWLRRGRGLHTEGDVRRSRPTASEVTTWDEAQANFSPVSRVEFVDDTLLQKAADWAAESDGRIVWCRHPGVVDHVAKLSKGRVKAYGPGSTNGEKLEKGKGPAVASYKSHGTGRNLQRFWEALTLGGPVKAAVLDQLIGRLWRAGQTEAVTYHIPLHTDEVCNPWFTTLEEARFLSDNLQPQAILRANVEL